MREKLTVTIDGKVIRKAKRYARRSKTSVSRMIEKHLDTLDRGVEASFASRWKGAFKTGSTGGDPRMNYLRKHHIKNQ